MASKSQPSTVSAEANQHMFDRFMSVSKTSTIIVALIVFGLFLHFSG